MSATVLDVALVRRLLAERRPMAEIESRTGASADSIERIYRAFPGQIEKTAAGLSKWAPHFDELRRMHGQGMTSTQVAGHFGVTRNAIIGVWSRLGLRSQQRWHIPRSAETIALARQRRNDRQNATRAERRGAEAAQPPEPRRTQASILAAILARPAEHLPMQDDDATLPKNLVPILVIDASGKLTANPALTEDTCRWWVGSPQQPGAGFCPDKKVSGLAYCDAHARRAHQPPQVRRPRAPAPKPERIPSFADAD